jgi:hypothetical protein
LTLNNRVIKAAENLYSGESIVVEIEDPGLVQLTASDYNLVLFGADKSILAASEPFTAADSKWTATLNTATAAFQSYYENVAANSAKTLGMMIVSRSTGDTICAGTISATSVPFPSQTSSIPDLYGDAMATMAANKMSKVASAVENNMAVFDATGGVKDVGLKVKRQVTTSEHGVSYGSLGIGDVRGIAEHDNSVAVGDFGYTDINGDNAVAVGINCGAGEGGVAVGEEAAAENNSVAIGYAACIEDANSVAVGEGAAVVCNSTGGTAVGEAANVDSSPNGTALGKSAYVSNAANAVQLGQGTNERPGTLQFRSFPLMDADGKLAKEVIGGRWYSGGAEQNTFIIDGRCYRNVYRIYASAPNQNLIRNNVFDYSSMTNPESDHFFILFQGSPKNLNLIFRTAGVDNEAQGAIQDLDIEGGEIDWTSNDPHFILFLVVIDDVGVPPTVFALTKWVSSH